MIITKNTIPQLFSLWWNLHNITNISKIWKTLDELQYYPKSKRHVIVTIEHFPGYIKILGNMVLRFRAQSLIDMVWVQIQPWSCCCALEKSTLRYFPLLGGLTSSTKLQSYVSLLKKKKSIGQQYLGISESRSG